MDFNNKLKIFYGRGITKEDSYITYTFPITFQKNYSMVVSTDYSSVVDGTTIPPVTWIGNVASTKVNIYGNSSFLSFGTKIYFKIIGIGY